VTSKSAAAVIKAAAEAGAASEPGLYRTVEIGIDTPEPAAMAEVWRIALGYNKGPGRQPAGCGRPRRGRSRRPARPGAMPRARRTTGPRHPCGPDRRPHQGPGRCPGPRSLSSRVRTVSTLVSPGPVGSARTGTGVLRCPTSGAECIHVRQPEQAATRLAPLLF
jgi:hypothetical protein